MCVEIDNQSLTKLFEYVSNHGILVEKYGENCHELNTPFGNFYAFKQLNPYIGENLETIYNYDNVLKFEEVE